MTGVLIASGWCMNGPGADCEGKETATLLLVVLLSPAFGNVPDSRAGIAVGSRTTWEQAATEVNVMGLGSGAFISLSVRDGSYILLKR